MHNVGFKFCIVEADIVAHTLFMTALPRPTGVR